VRVDWIVSSELGGERVRTVVRARPEECRGDSGFAPMRGTLPCRLLLI
jgi:hypothetical protein